MSDDQSGFKSIIQDISTSRSTSSIEKTVRELGFPNGATLREINDRIVALGYESFPEHQLRNSSQQLVLPHTLIIVKR